MKYVILKNNEGRKIPIIFDKIQSHDKTAELFQAWETRCRFPGTSKPVSAGRVRFNGKQYKTWDKSDTLCLSSRPEDGDVLTQELLDKPMGFLHRRGFQGGMILLPLDICDMSIGRAMIERGYSFGAVNASINEETFQIDCNPILKSNPDVVHEVIRGMVSLLEDITRVANCDLL
jgi:hypothetical protein